MEASLDTHEAEEYVTSIIPEATSTDLPTVGYESLNDSFEFVQEQENLTELENQAHAQRVLLSSDAMRYFAGKASAVEERPALLDIVIAKARTTFPSEDGWVVVNLVRMEQLLEEVNEQNDSLVVDAPLVLPESEVPSTAGSLAEAIITGNVVAAYELIAHRPMIALADATADLDALYRMRNGEESESISDMLQSQSVGVSTQQLQNAIQALTSVLDGTYTDEESAVKMAIIKAVRAVAN